MTDGEMGDTILVMKAKHGRIGEEGRSTVGPLDSRLVLLECDVIKVKVEGSVRRVGQRLIPWTVDLLCSSWMS